MKRKEKDTTFRYSLPARMVSGLSVNKRIMVSGIEKEIAKNRSEIIMDNLSAKPMIFSMVFLSPLPQYWAHRTEVPVARP